MKVELISITPHAERVIEEAGRTAYLSFDKFTPKPILRLKGKKELLYTENYPDLEGAKVGEEVEVEGRKFVVEERWKNSAEKFIKMLIRSGHLSVLEHAYASFRIRGGSRSFTHQLVRHRMASFTQQSQRYVNEENFQYVVPPSIEKDPEALGIYRKFMEEARRTYSQLRRLKIKKEDARFVLPNAVFSEIVITANFREWRHIIELRGSKHAQWEIRRMAVEVLRILKEKAPSVFYDFYVEGDHIIRRG